MSLWSIFFNPNELAFVLGLNFGQGRSTKGLLLGKLSRSGQRPAAWPEGPFCWANPQTDAISSDLCCCVFKVSHAYTACLTSAGKVLLTVWPVVLVKCFWPLIRSKDGGVLEDCLQFSFSVCFFFGLQESLDAISKMAALEIHIKWPPPWFSCGFLFVTKRLAVMPSFMEVFDRNLLLL